MFAVIVGGVTMTEARDVTSVPPQYTRVLATPLRSVIEPATITSRRHSHSHALRSVSLFCSEMPTCRRDLLHLRELRTQTFGPPKYESLVAQLLKRILDSSKPDLQPDVQHVSTGLLDLLKTGFSMFKKVR